MNELRWTRLCWAGLAAGAVLLAGETILNSYILGIEWQQVLIQLRAAPLSGVARGTLAIMTLLLGVFQAWLIARLDASGNAAKPKVVLEAALILWVTLFAFPGCWLVILGIFPARLMAFGTLWGLGECVLSSLLAGRLYLRD